MKWSFLVPILLALYFRYAPRKSPITLQEPYYSHGWKKVADTFREHVESGWQLGGGFSVYYKGELVVQCTGGYADGVAHMEFTEGTLVQHFSATKVVAAVVIATLVDRGLLDYNKPVSKYWPEFVKHDKGRITVLQLLSHTAGLSVFEEPFALTDILNQPEEIEKILLNQKPLWERGESIGYQGIALGLYEDVLVRRVDPKHRSLSQYFTEEIAQPFGIDFFIGLPKEENHRCARNTNALWHSLRDVLHSYNYWFLQWNMQRETSYVHKMLHNPAYVEKYVEHHNNVKWREVPCPSTQGFGTVQSVAKLLGILANGGYHEDYQLLSEEMIRLLQKPVSMGQDLVLLRNMTYGRGVNIWNSPKGSLVFGSPGESSGVAKCDPDNKLAYSYQTSHMTLYSLGDDPKLRQLEQAVYKCVDELKQTDSYN